MPIIFSDEDLMYLDRKQDDQLRSLRHVVDALKAKGDTTFCRKCGHMMQYFTVGNAKLLQCIFCGNRIAQMIEKM